MELKASLLGCYCSLLQHDALTNVVKRKTTVTINRSLSVQDHTGISTQDQITNLACAFSKGGAIHLGLGKWRQYGLSSAVNTFFMRYKHQGHVFLTNNLREIYQVTAKHETGVTKVCTSITVCYLGLSGGMWSVIKETLNEQKDWLNGYCWRSPCW